MELTRTCYDKVLTMPGAWACVITLMRAGLTTCRAIAMVQGFSVINWIASQSKLPIEETDDGDGTYAEVYDEHYEKHKELATDYVTKFTEFIEANEDYQEQAETFHEQIQVLQT